VPYKNREDHKANCRKRYASDKPRHRAAMAKWLARHSGYELARGRRRAGLPAPTRPCPAVCEGCGGVNKSGRALALDHVGNTFRGWLCIKCNRTLGLADNSGARLRGLLRYLRRHT
jgi:hypothetical protein